MDFVGYREKLMQKAFNLQIPRDYCIYFGVIFCLFQDIQKRMYTYFVKIQNSLYSFIP